MQRKIMMVYWFVLVLVSTACQSQRPEDTVVRELAAELRRACVARAGGPAMDAVEVFGGRLHQQCARWAHAQVHHRLP